MLVSCSVWKIVDGLDGRVSVGWRWEGVGRP